MEWSLDAVGFINFLTRPIAGQAAERVVAAAPRVPTDATDVLEKPTPARKEPLPKLPSPPPAGKVSGKRFKRALILSGAGANVPLLLGFVDGTSAAGKPADLVIGTCGGSITAALVNSIPDPDARYEFVRSKEFYRLLRGLELKDVTLWEFAKELYGLHRAASINLKPEGARVIPENLFRFALMRTDGQFERLPQFNRDFANTGTRAIIVAAKAEFSPADAGTRTSARRKLFTETYLTDPDTARAIQGVTSFSGTSFPSSTLDTKTNVESNLTLLQAVRASITDPLLIAPARIGASYYLGGAADLYPLSLAKQLADEVVARDPVDFGDAISRTVVASTFGFDPKHMKQKALRDGADYWIDAPEGTYPSLSPVAALNVWGAIKAMNPARIVKLSSAVPDTYEEYKDMFDAQYRIGHKGAFDAVSGGNAPHGKR